MKHWMYCLDCQTFFKEEDGEKGMEKETGWKYVRCPHCESIDTDDANTCPMCGEPTKNEDICDDCRSALVDGVDDLIDSMITDGDRDAAHDAAKQFLCDAWSGVL